MVNIYKKNKTKECYETQTNAVTATLVCCGDGEPQEHVQAKAITKYKVISKSPSM